MIMILTIIMLINTNATTTNDNDTTTTNDDNNDDDNKDITVIREITSDQQRIADDLSRLIDTAIYMYNIDIHAHM